MSIRSRALNKLFKLLYGPLVFLHEPAGVCLFGPSWARRRYTVGKSLPSAGLALDVGCGSGILLARLGTRNGMTVGIDPSAAMTRRARAHGGRVIRVDAAHIPLADGSVSGVVCSYPGPWIRDPKVWNELARVTMPGSPVTILLGGTVTRGRFSSARSKLIHLLYGSGSIDQQDIQIEWFGHARLSGCVERVADEWGEAIVWRGTRGAND